MSNATTAAAGRPGLSDGARTSSETNAMKRTAIVIQDDGFDQMLPPLAYAYAQACRGVEVDILFDLWAVRALTDEGAHMVAIDDLYAGDLDGLPGRRFRRNLPTNITDFLKLLAATGKVRFYASQYATSTFGVKRADLMAETEGIVDPSWFQSEKIGRADHYRLF